MLRRFRDSHHFMAFFVQVCATSLGLLMALGIDQWKSDRARPQSVQQTCQALSSELTGDQAELRKELASLQKGRDALTFMRRVLVALRKGPIPQGDSLRTSVNTPPAFRGHPAILQAITSALAACGP